MALEFHQFLCLSDNFGLLAHDSATGATAALDAPEAGPIFAALDAKGWTLTDIWLTHHHADHIGAAGALKERFPGARVVGARQGRPPPAAAGSRRWSTATCRAWAKAGPS